MVDTEGDRRIRVRARRIGQEDTLGGVVLSLEDVTDELRAERVLAWGEMARQVAHEVKNPLTPIKLSVQHIRRAWDDRRPDFDSILTRNANAMLIEIDRLASIAQSFSRLGAPGEAAGTELAEVDLAQALDEVLALYSGGRGSVSFTRTAAPDLPAVRARGDEVKEVLVNLLENARAAVGERGQVRVEAKLDGPEVLLTVSDDGSGIPEDVLPRVFEPHFSTRSTGTGLGLAIVRRLVESWNGTIRVDSRPDEGTRITLRLRAWEAPRGGGETGDPAD